MEKEVYEELKMEVIPFETEDVIITSDQDPGHEITIGGGNP